MVMILVQRMQKRGLSVQPDGRIRDGIGVFDPATINYSELVFRLHNLAAAYNSVMATAVV